MAIRRKAKARRKRKKASITTTARTTGKKTVNKASPRPVSTKKAKPPAKTMGKPTSVSERAPEADRPLPSRPAEQRIGVVTHYYGYLPVVAMRLEPGATLRVGDVIHIRGHTTDFTQKIELLEVNRAPVTEVGPNDNFGVKVVKHVFEHDVVFKARP